MSLNILWIEYWNPCRDWKKAYNSPAQTPHWKRPISVWLKWWKLECDNHTGWPWDSTSDQHFLCGPAIPPPVCVCVCMGGWVVRMPIPEGLLFSCRGIGFSQPVGRYKLHSWQGCSCGRAGGDACSHPWLKTVWLQAASLPRICFWVFPLAGNQA